MIRTIKCILAFLVITATTAQATTLLSENFDDVTTLAGKGWALINNSDPLGTTGWFQGNDAVFGSQAGAANSYIAANFENAAFGGNISNWLLTPVLTFYSGQTTLSFFTRTEDPPVFQDGLEVRLSAAGPSINVGTTSTSVGDFISGVPVDLTGVWTERSIFVFNPGMDPVDGRLAFRYIVSDTSINGDYLGIDSVSVTYPDLVATPEPSTLGCLGLGIAGLALWRRKRIGHA